MSGLGLVLLAGDYVVLRLPPTAAVPPWVGLGPFSSISRSSDELSIVCRADLVPATAEARVESGWRCWRVEGTLDFALTGILASIAAPLAAAKISMFAVSTFDTDYVLVKGVDLPRATEALARAGFALLS